MPIFWRKWALLGILASLLGLTFATLSSVDYAAHLDRHLHDVHCSLVPGLTSGADQENPCRVAMYSAYAALFRGAFWGGIPISLFALGAFSFFLGFSLYLLLAGAEAPASALTFYAVAASTPLTASLVMFVISVTKLGSICKTCLGIYLSSLLLAAAAWFAYRSLHREAHPSGNWFHAAIWLAGLGLCTLVPSLVYASAIPDQRPYLKSCGKLPKLVESHNALIKMRTASAVRPAILFEDPLCPTCRAFHQRMLAEGAFDRLDIQMALFPLDSSCNWMLSSPLHPGACLVSRAVICGGDKAREVLEWAYDQQDELQRLAKLGEAQLKAAISEHFGATLANCTDAPATKLRLNHQLHFAADNAVPVSTPQMYLGDQKVCDEDSDLGLRYTLKQLAPEVVP
jgi:hypothetical protein